MMAKGGYAGLIFLLAIWPLPFLPNLGSELSSVTLTGAGREWMEMSPSTNSHISLKLSNPVIPFDTDNEFTYSLPVPEPPLGIQNYLRLKDLVYDAGMSQAHPTSIDPAGASIHTPISITCDSDFSLQGWPGTGTAEDPYRIEEIRIDVLGNSTPCIMICNTTVHFIITTCLLLGSYYAGVYLSNATNGLITSNVFNTNYLGTYLVECENCTVALNTYINNGFDIYAMNSTSLLIERNTCMPSMMGEGITMFKTNCSTIANNTITSYPYSSPWAQNCGIFLIASQFNLIFNNTCTNTIWGIYLILSPQNTFVNNSLWSCGFWFGLSREENRQNLVSNNTVNGKPLVFLIDQEGGVVQEAGQVILTNCTGITVCDQTLNNCTTGIFLVDSSLITLTNNTCNGNSYSGILLYNSTRVTVSGSTCNGCGQYGLSMLYSYYCNITGNTCNNNYSSGIKVISSENNTVSSNTCNHNRVGIGVTSESHYNIIANNTCISNEYECISIEGSSHVTVTHNVCGNSDTAIFLFSGSNTVTHNLLTNSTYGLYLAGSGSNRIIGNSLVGCGLYLTYSMSHVLASDLRQEEVSDNTVNGKSLVFWQDRVGGTVPEGAGQVVLLNCSDVTVQGQTLNNCTIGVHLRHTRNIKIVNNTCSHNIYGLYLLGANSTLITNNTFSHNHIGLHIEYQYWIGFFIIRSCRNTSVLWNAFINNSWLNILDHGLETTINYNYWSDYEGYDKDGDGVGDTPHPVEDWNTDPNPLMLPPGSPVTWLKAPVDQVIPVGVPFRYDLDATAMPPGLDTWWINDTARFSINQYGVITNIVTLTAGVYPIQVWVNDTYGNTITAIFILTVHAPSSPPNPPPLLSYAIIVAGVMALAGVTIYNTLMDIRRKRSQS